MIDLEDRFLAIDGEAQQASVDLSAVDAMVVTQVDGTNWEVSFFMGGTQLSARVDQFSIGTIFGRWKACR